MSVVINYMLKGVNKIYLTIHKKVIAVACSLRNNTRHRFALTRHYVIRYIFNVTNLNILDIYS